MAKKNCFAPQVITDQTFEDAPPDVPCPLELEHVWEWFTELDQTRQSNMQHGPITHTEIRSWAANMCINLLPLEVRALMAVDRAFLIHSHSESRKQAEKG